MRPIRHWPGYLHSQAQFAPRFAVADELPAAGPVAKQRALQTELAEIKQTLDMLPEPNRDCQPAEFAAVQAKAAPLRERRKILKEQLDKIRKQIQ